MSELLDSLNAPAENGKTWAAEVAEVAAPAASVPEPASEEQAHSPAPTEEAAPEPSEAQEEAPEAPDRRVPLKALQEERQKRAEYERQVQDYQRQLGEYQAWAAEVQRQQQAMMGHNGGPPLEQQQPQEPDPETDPIGALKYAREQQRQMQETIQQERYVQQLNQVAYQAATQFQQQAPDYQDAYRYALNSRAQELVALGTPPQAVPQILQQEELRLIDTALQNRRNPAEAIYHFAKARGYQGKQAAPAPVAPAPAPDPVLQQAKQAVAASASAGGASSSKGSVSVADLANLKGAAFDSAWNKVFGGNKSSIFRE